jgi:hypothetical protein
MAQTNQSKSTLIFIGRALRSEGSAVLMFFHLSALNTSLHILSDDVLHLCYEARMIVLIVSSAIVGINQTWTISLLLPDRPTRRLILSVFMIEVCCDYTESFNTDGRKASWNT